jgi:predicted acetyltransferase
MPLRVYWTKKIEEWKFKMDCQLSPAKYSEKDILRHLLELYSYEFSELDGGDVNEFGLYDYEYLDHYWTEGNRYPYLVRVNGKLAGFVLLRRASYIHHGELGDKQQTPMSVAEFFVMRKYRRRGIGTHIITNLFDRFPGRWEVAELANDHEAQSFWRKVITDYTGGQYEEVFLNSENWHGPVQVFETPK